MKAGSQAIVAVEENGRKVYVNDVAATPAPAPQKARAPEYRLVYWSQTEQRWKPVPGANGMKAAASAARDVQQLLGIDVPKANNVDSASPATPAELATTAPATSAGKSPFA